MLSPVVSSHVLTLWWLDEAATGFHGIAGPWGARQGAKGDGLGFQAACNGVAAADDDVGSAVDAFGALTGLWWGPSASWWSSGRG